MTRIVPSLSALGMIAAVATPAAAQRESRDYGRPEMTPENLAAMALKGSSFCARKSASATAEKVLDAPLGSDEEARRVKALHTVARQCYKPQWPVFPATAVRNALAEIEYREHHREAPAPVAAGTPPPASFAVAPADAKGTPDQEAAWYLGALANCVVFVDNAGAYQLISGPSNVSEEIRRFELLRPAMRRCGNAADVDKLNARTFRGFVASALLSQARSRQTGG